jgi:glyoxylase-like metal-dependent hydrolase (beta-lactamase superfamily II)/rhodanese-related sulfurtransferase
LWRLLFQIHSHIIWQSWPDITPADSSQASPPNDATTSTEHESQNIRRLTMNEITVSELMTKLENGEAVTVLDIREADEFADWHIHGSRNLPTYNALNRRQADGFIAQIDSLPRDNSIVAVCRAGNTSRLAARILESKGYKAFSLSGGIRGWSEAYSEARIPLSGHPDATLIQIRRNGKGCLSYLIGSKGQAAVVDPSLDASVYTGVAAREGLKITHVLETHIQGDHLSRGRELSAATGAEYILPENQRVRFQYKPIHGGDTLQVGDLTIDVLATPGHTEESVSYHLDATVLLTGDTLFVESVGRPDLEKGDAGAEAGARMLHKSLHQSILKIADDVRVYPAHHGKPIGFDAVPVGAALGELKSNIGLLKLEEQTFVQTILASLQAKPPNFQAIIAINEGKEELGWIEPLDLEAGPNRCAVA